MAGRTLSPRTTASAPTTGSWRPSMSATGGALLANDPHLGHLDAVDLVHQRPALHDGRRRLPVRCRRRQLPGRARRRPRPQRADRVGRDQRRPGRPGPRHRDASTRPTRPATWVPTALAAVHDPDRDDRGQRRRAGHPAVRETVHGPILNDVDEPPADAPPMALRWTGDPPGGRPGRHARGDPGPQRGRRTTTTSAPRCRAYRRRPRTSSTPTSTATSATSCPGYVPVRVRSGPTAATGRSTATTASGEWTRLHPVRRPAMPRSIRPRAGSSRPTTPRSTTPGRTSSARVGPRLPRRADHRPGQRVRRGRPRPPR